MSRPDASPLSGVRVLDLSQVLSGPYCTMMLADAGADVIKVEPLDGDHIRGWLTGGEAPASAYFLAANRTKRSVALDLKQDDGRTLLLDLAAASDVLVENFRPGVMARLGLGYEDVRRRNERIIYCSVSGFGQSGPLSQKAAYDLIAAGYGGVMSVTGDDGGRFCRPGVPVSDLLAAAGAAYSIVLALLNRQRSGRGCHVDVAMMDTLVWAMAHHILAYQVSGQVAGPCGSAHPQVAPYQSFRTGSIDVNIAVLNDKQWQAFCEVLARPDWLADPRYGTTESRCAHRRDLEREIEEVLVTRPADEWLERLERAGIPCGPINTVAELVRDEHLQERGMFLDLEHPTAGRLKLPGAPWRLPDVPERWDPPPEVGQHTDLVLQEVLGLSGDRLRELRARRVIGGG